MRFHSTLTVISKISILQISWIILSALVLTIPLAAQDRAADLKVDKKALVRALQKGGHVIYFRHAATEHSQTDSDRANLSNCATQRNLSELGREQARAIGKAFKGLGVKVSTVITSPYCRCIEMGKLAFGDATVSDDLTFAISQNEEEAKRLAAALRRLLGAKPPEGTTTVLISHTANLKEATGIWPKLEAEAHIFEPHGDGTFSHIRQVLLEEWAELVKLK
jgi:broad specificity phosphatase PhoE